MKMIDIKHDRIRWCFFVIQIELRCIVIEEFLVVKTGQLISFCQAERLPVFGELYRSQYAG